MQEYIQNPRRSPRAPVRCHARVISAQGTFEAVTDDVGGHGCQLVSPRLVRKGEPVQLVVSREAMKTPLRVAGRIAWASDRSPWRLGIAYDESSLAQSAAWFEQLLATDPGLAAFRRIPDRLALDAIVYLASPPRFLVDFTPDEVVLLRAVGSGVAVAELRALLRDRWNQALRALFSLLAHQHVTLQRGASVHPDAWRKILSEVEASMAADSLPEAPAGVPELVSVPPVPAWTAPPARPPARPTPAPVRAPEAEATPADWLVPAASMVPPSWHPPAPAGPPRRHAPTPEPRGVTRSLDEGGSWADTPFPGAAGHAPGPAGHVPGTARRSARSPEAQGCYERALAEAAAGHAAGALALLRRALALAPGDAEIAGAMAGLMRQR